MLVSSLTGSLIGSVVAHDVVVGHTDAIGSEVYNQALSQRRSQAVAVALEALTP